MIILNRNSSETARSYAMRVLLYNIIHVELQPGSAVSENELSSALSLSRTPIREALIELNRIGLVEILPQRGSYISKINYFYINLLCTKEAISKWISLFCVKKYI